MDELPADAGGNAAIAALQVGDAALRLRPAPR